MPKRLQNAAALQTSSQQVWATAIRLFRAIVGPALFERARFIRIHHYLPRLRHPRTFAEHIVHRKLYARLPNLVETVDKYAVRQRVEERVGKQYLNTLHWVGEDLRKFDWDAMPSAFVAKAAYGCGPDFMLIVGDKKALGRTAFLQWAEQVLDLTFGEDTQEWWYARIPRRIIIEDLLVDKRFPTPLDYKFYVFHGKVRFLTLDYDRFGSHLINVYLPDWTKAPFALRTTPRDAPPFDRPAKLDEMIAVAEKLAAGWDFVRVDLYCVNDEQIVFGEITPVPGGGRMVIRSPENHDLKFGQLWKTGKVV